MRVVVGVTFSMHGMQKLFGWFGGGGFDGTSKWFSSLGFGDGRTATLMAGGSEIAGGLGLALGLLTPLAAAAMVGTMTTAAFVNNADNGFWSANKGWELNLYLIVVAVAVAITGPGTVVTGPRPGSRRRSPSRWPASWPAVRRQCWASPVAGPGGPRGTCRPGRDRSNPGLDRCGANPGLHQPNHESRAGLDG